MMRPNVIHYMRKAIVQLVTFSSFTKKNELTIIAIENVKSNMLLVK